MIRSLALMCLATGLMASSPGNFTKVLNFGDSWAWLGQSELKNALKPFGVSLETHAIPGAPVALFALTPKALANTVRKSGAQAVVLSIGGNDFLEGMPKLHKQDAILAEMLLDTDRLLMPLFKEFPDVHVYHFGYEILNWAGSPHCETYGYNELGTICKLGYLDTKCCVKTQINFLQTLYVDALAVKYAGKYNYHGLNMLGTLQKHGGIPGADVGKPVLTQYSPAQYVRSDNTVWGCVHLTKSGYTVLYEELVKKMGFESASGQMIHNISMVNAQH